METYVTALNYAIPFFVFLLVVETIVARIQGVHVVRSMDTLSSLSSGLTNIIKDVLGLTVIIVSYSWMVEHMALISFEATWIVYLLAFIGLDFAGYWVHRISHKVNYFWNHHIIHHSSEEYNLGCALRQTLSAWFSITFIFLIPIALLGVPARLVAIIGPIHLFAQYWYHTRLIGKMGFLEKIIVTPSHHRVHHAINDIYIDKNLSQVFIFWDKIFGTFQQELDDVPPVYGVKRPVKTWNPFIINFMHLWQILKDVWYTKSWYDKIRIWFMPTGWRPQDVINKFPLKLIDDPYSMVKYEPRLSDLLKGWSWVQYVFNFASMLYLFNNITAIGFPSMLFYGAFLFFSIFSFTMLMDKSNYAWLVESLKSLVGIGIIYFEGDWFLIDSIISSGSYYVGIYYIISMIIVLMFTRMEFKESPKKVVTQTA